VVVRPIESEEKVGDIYLPDTAKDKPTRGEVVAVGPGRLTRTGSRIGPAVKVGDRVLFSKFAGSEVKIGNVEYKIITESEILAIVQ
jgi:chaperonin GroES